jgi:hypothetical protein
MQAGQPHGCFRRDGLGDERLAGGSLGGSFRRLHVYQPSIHVVSRKVAWAT